MLPASYGQQRLWLLDQVRPGSPVYNTVGPLRIRGQLDADLLHRALNAVVARHEVLRTVFRLDGADVAAVVAAAAALLLDVVDAGADVDVEERIRVLAAVPFDLAVGPLVRCHLLRVAPGEHVLLVVMHHAIGDPRSTGILLGELAACYEAYGRGEEPKLPELPVQYPDYAAWQRQMVDSGALAGSLRHWRERLAGAAPLRLPADLPGPARPTYAAATAPVTIPGEAVGSLRGAGGGATEFMVVMAGYAALLARWSGQSDVVVAFPFDGRDQPELTDMVGYFVNTLPVRVDLSGDPPFRSVLRQVRAGCLAAYAHAAVPFEHLVEALSPGREAGRLPLARAWLVLQDDRPVPAFGGLDAEPVVLPPAHLPFDVAVSLRHHATALAGHVAVAADAFLPQTARAVADSLVDTLRAAAAAPDTPLSALPARLAARPRPVAPPATAPVPDRTAAPPGTAVEHLLARLWTEILETDEVSIDDEFYALGGNSLRAVRVVTQARERGVELPLDVVLGEHTIRQLAAAATAAAAAPGLDRP